MIKIQSVHIEEFRGIRKLDIELNGKTFAVSGPNGSGKSGVIDAIEFGLTGQIRRLTGRGTKGLTVVDHGPHVDRRDFPDTAFVEINLSFPTLGKTAKIKRKVSSPKKPKIVPQDKDICSILNEVAQHPEVTLARREILRFILVEPSKRSEEIQTILKIEELGQTRSAFNSAFGKLKRQAESADKEVQRKRTALLQHLSINSLSSKEILKSVNEKRVVLGLAKFEEISAKTVLDQGLTEPSSGQSLNKSAALIELNKLRDVIEEIQKSDTPAAEALVGYITRLEEDSQLLLLLRQRELIDQGLPLVDGPECPMCDHKWPDEAHLLAHLQAKQEKSKTAGSLKDKMLDQAALLFPLVGDVKALLGEAYRIVKTENYPQFLSLVESWGKELASLQKSLGNFADIQDLKPRLSSSWLSVPIGFERSLSEFISFINSKPDQSATIAAQTFLLNAEERFKDFKEARKASSNAAKARDISKHAYDAWCKSMETVLDELYDAVQDDFSKFYRILNDGDENKFVAKLKATEGKLDFDVNFYERGLFPPGAYHSEGHQDGMGVCLYLALMKRLLNDGFTVALLDDVVMSVDTDHRYQFCKLLMSEFPNTQFVIATHDKLWAEQMRSAKLVSRKSSLAFHSWTVDDGPLIESNVEIWDEIDATLKKNKIETAAHSLRHHMEFVSRLLADQLGARPVFKAAGNYDLGDLLPCSIFRLKELFGKAVDAAQSWGNNSMKDVALERKRRLALANSQKGEEDWAVNKAVHYNEWANFSRNDFTPVVKAFRSLLECAQCDNCNSWLYVIPKNGPPESLRCSCGETNMNLKRKPS